MAKRSDGEGSIYQTPDGWWHAAISRGKDPETGRRLRSYVKAKTKQGVREKLNALLEDQREGTFDRRNATVNEWLAVWLDMAEHSLKPASVAGYRTDAKRLADMYGNVQLKKLTTEQIEVLYASLRRRGLSGTTVQGVHRSLRASLNEAVRRGWLAKNPVLHARPGRTEEHEIEPLSTGEAKAILEAAKGQRNAARWAIALSLGLRQGEALGLCWNDVDLEAGTLQIKRTLQRVSWKHGCDPACGLPARQCPQRRDGGLVILSPKSRSGRRTIAVPAPVLDELRRHRRQQAEERLAAGELWRPGPNGGWVFAQANGKPVDPGRDWKSWKDLLKKAGVRDVRLHDARHSAATYLLLQGVDARTVMGMLGWSQVSMTARYQHPVAELMQEAAQRVGDLLWGEQER